MARGWRLPRRARPERKARAERPTKSARPARSDAKLKARLQQAAWLSELQKVGLPAPVAEYVFDRIMPEIGQKKLRRWAFDFCWPDRMVAVEIDGMPYLMKTKDGVAFTGRHTSAKGFMADQEKRNKAQALGYVVLSYTYETLLLPESIALVATVYHSQPSQRQT